MTARMWYMGVALAGLAALLASGCQGSGKKGATNQKQQVSKAQQVDPATLSETATPEIQPDTHVAAGRLHETQGRLARAAEQYQLAIKAGWESSWMRLASSRRRTRPSAGQFSLPPGRRICTTTWPSATPCRAGGLRPRRSWPRPSSFSRASQRRTSTWP
jgi:hypothetical protein